MSCKLSRCLILLSIIGLAATALPTVSIAQNAPLFERGEPWGAEDLPPGRFRTKLESLPAPARQRAMNWLRGFTFTEQDLKQMKIDPNGAIYFSDTILPDDPPDEESAGLDKKSQLDALSLAETFALHSNPGAPNTVYLDFDGHRISGTAWNQVTRRDPLVARAYDIDGQASGFNSEERANIAEIWHRVADDLAPFDIDVTTEEPAQFNPQVGRVVITSDVDQNDASMPSRGGGGVAYVDIFGSSDAGFYSPALVYYNNLGDGFAPFVAEASSHEFGHNLGLSHDGTRSQTYYGGHGSGFVSWAPIMGVSYDRNVTQWSKGEYTGANNPQDDIAIIEDKLTYRVDDHGDTFSQATPLSIESNGEILVSNPEDDPDNLFPANKGVIDFRRDVDVFSIDVGAGRTKVTITPAWDAFTRNSRRGANLDVRAALYDNGGNRLARSGPGDDTDSAISRDLSAGRYFLTVTGVGSSIAPYSSYGSLGQYFISGRIAPKSNVERDPPTPDPLTWATQPTATGSGSITMTATTAVDETGPVEYFFNCAAGGKGCVNSGWQTSRRHDLTGLDADAVYSFRVKARDGNDRRTDWSPIRSTRTASGASTGPVANVER